MLLADGRVLVSGGSDERDDRGVYASTEIFDPARSAFTPGPSMAFGRYKHAGTSQLLASGQVLLAGGASRAELFDPVTRQFTAVPGAATLTGQFSAAAALPSGEVLNHWRLWRRAWATGSVVAVPAVSVPPVIGGGTHRVLLWCVTTPDCGWSRTARHHRTTIVPDMPACSEQS